VEVRHVHILDDDSEELLSLAQIVTKLGFTAICYSDCDKFLGQFNDPSTGCLILEIKMAGGRGFDVLETLVKRTIVPPIIVSTRHADVPSVVHAYQIAKPIAFLQRQTMSEIALLEAIQSALAHDDEQRSAFARRQELEARLQQLSQPETAVLELLLQGADHTKISTELAISRRTVENRRVNIMKKLGTSCFPELVRIVLDAGHTTRP
jgi:FixJ family two-component response regulator